jgi:hypothetical protein
MKAKVLGTSNYSNSQEGTAFADLVVPTSRAVRAVEDRAQ